MHADVQRLAAVWIPRRIEQPVNRLGIRAFGRIPVGLILYCVLALYSALIVYELKLLDAW